MSSFIAAAREELAQTIRQALPDVPVLLIQPETLYPPAIIIAEDDPFLEPADSAQTWNINFAIDVHAPISSDNVVMLKALDDMVAALIEGLSVDYKPAASAYHVQNADNGQPSYSARFTLTSAGWQKQKED